MLWREPTCFWLLAAVVVIGVIVALRLHQRASMLSAFADPALIRRLAPHVDQRRRWIRLALRVAALALLVVALAGPKWGFQWEEVQREGIDLIVAIDTSRSMLATDVKPNRLERAKLAVLDLIQKLHGDRVGLVAFAGTAFLQCPLTLDYAAFAGALEAVNVGLIPRGGTALGRAIETSLDAFEARQGRYEVMILITDGEDNTGDFEAASKQAAELGVKIYTVGIGTAEGELIPAGKDGAQGFVKDRSGQVVKSRLNEDALRQIALASGGAYVRGVGASLGLDEVFRDHISKIEKREVASTLERRYEDRFQIFLAAALVLLLTEALIGERKRDRATARRWLRFPFPRRSAPGEVVVGRSVGARAAGVTTAVRTGLVLVALYPILVGWFDPPGDRAAEGNTLYAEGKYTEATERYGEGLVDSPASPLLQFNLGDAQYKLGKYTEAMNAFTKTATEGTAEWTARAAYNLGNAYYRLGANAEASDPKAAIGSYEQALAAYKRAMGADPSDPDPKFNHEFVTQKLADLRKKLEEQQKEEEKKQQEQQQEQDQQDQQQQDQQEKQDQQQEQQDQKDQQEAQQPDQQEQGDQQQQQAEQQQPEQKEERGEQQQQQAAGDQGEKEQPQAAEQQAAGGEGEGEPDQDHQAAQAVLDTARSEELGPDEMQRQVGVAGVGEAAQDW